LSTLLAHAEKPGNSEGKLYQNTYGLARLFSFSPLPRRVAVLPGNDPALRMPFGTGAVQKRTGGV